MVKEINTDFLSGLPIRQLARWARKAPRSTCFLTTSFNNDIKRVTYKNSLNRRLMFRDSTFPRIISAHSPQECVVNGRVGRQFLVVEIVVRRSGVNTDIFSPAQDKIKIQQRNKRRAQFVNKKGTQMKYFVLKGLPLKK